MEMIMEKGFSVLNENELVYLDGGIDWGGVVKGAFETVAGVVEGVAGMVGVLTPEPLTTALGAIAVVDGAERGANGLELLVNSFKK